MLESQSRALRTRMII